MSPRSGRRAAPSILIRCMPRLLAEQAGADSITVHLREDRRPYPGSRRTQPAPTAADAHETWRWHSPRRCWASPASCSPRIAAWFRKKRAEVTTEGGLDVASQVAAPHHLRPSVWRPRGVRLSLFIDPDPRQVEAAGPPRGAGHRTAHRCLRGQLRSPRRAEELSRLLHAAQLGVRLGLSVACRSRAELSQTCSRWRRSARSSS